MIRAVIALAAVLRSTQTVGMKIHFVLMTGSQSQRSSLPMPAPPPLSTEGATDPPWAPTNYLEKGDADVYLIFFVVSAVAVYPNIIH